MPDLPPNVRRSTATPAPAPALAERYLELLKGCLTRELFVDERWVQLDHWEPNRLLADPTSVRQMLAAWNARLMVRSTADHDWTIGMTDVPATAETMVGKLRLDNVHELLRRAIAEDVPGDLVETGVWRGGVVAFMRAALDAYGDADRLVWACDSFEGMPQHAGERFAADRAVVIPSPHSTDRFDPQLAVSLDEVQANLARYGLLDDRIRFVVGWFNQTLAKLPIRQIAVLRLDGDLYESTWDALTALEPKVAQGGFVIIDDFGAFDVCRQAVEDYRAQRGITDEIHRVDWSGVWWQQGHARAEAVEGR